MYRLRERSSANPNRAVPVIVGRNFPLQNWNPPLADQVTLQFVLPGNSTRYELMYDEDFSAELKGAHDATLRSQYDHRRWKSCQHYLKYLGDGNPLGLSTKIPWTCVSLTSLGMYSSIPNGLGVGGGTYIDSAITTDTGAFRSAFGAFGDHIAGLPSLYTASGAGGYVPQPTNLSLLTKAALTAMLPSIKADMSLINNIIELKDFKSLPETLSRLHRLVPGNLGRNFKWLENGRLKSSYWNSVPPALKRLYKSFRTSTPTLRQVLGGASDAYLQKEFNIEPLLRDIAATSRGLYKLEASMRKLINKSGRRLRRHFTTSWREYESPTLYVKTLTGQSLSLGQFAGSTSPAGRTGVSNAHAQVFAYTRRTTHPEPTVFHAEIEYSYYFTQYQREHALLLTLLDKLGVNLDPSIIWNAIPWSFVVDWMFSVGKYLGEQKVLNMEPAVSVHRYCWSWTKKRKTSLWFRSTANQNSGTQFNPSISDTYLPELWEIAYRRDISLPDASSSLFGSGLSAKELSLAVALANTPGRRPHTRWR
jgi:hypothetical protein